MKNKKLLTAIIIVLMVILIGIGIGYAVYKYVNNSKTDDNSQEDHLNPNDDTQQEAKVDWTSLVFTIDGTKYSYPFKISDFANNGWVAQSSDDEKVLNEMIDTDFLQSIFPDYDGTNIDNLGYYNVNLKQNDLMLSLYFDLQNLDTKVADADVVRLDIESVSQRSEDFDFYGIKFGTKKEKIEEIFGTRNYEVTEDDGNEYYSYFNTLKDNNIANLEFVINKNNNEVSKISLDINK